MSEMLLKNTMNNLSKNSMINVTSDDDGKKLETNFKLHYIVSGAVASGTVVTETREPDAAAGTEEIQNNTNESNVGAVADTASVTNSNDECENATGGGDSNLAGADHQLLGQDGDALAHLPYEWSPLLEEMANSVQNMERTYYDGKGFASDFHVSAPAPGTPVHKNKGQEVKMDNGIKENWADAPEFQPAFVSNTGRVKSYAEAVDPYCPRNRTKLAQGVEYCPYTHLNPFDMSLCPYLHGQLCPFCLTAVIDCEETEEKLNHIKVCIKEQEAKIKTSLAIQKSKGIACNICLEFVKDKVAGEARFGILPNCNHCFCITCIRTWRQEARQSSQVTKSTFFRACPICRVESQFVCPSAFWFETPAEKESLIADYKNALSLKPCRLFNFGEGKCPFGDKCFYLHSLPDGTLAPSQSQRPLRLNAEGTARVQDYVLWDFIAARDNPENYQALPPAERNTDVDSNQEPDSAT